MTKFTTDNVERFTLGKMHVVNLEPRYTRFFHWVTRNKFRPTFIVTDIDRENNTVTLRPK